jgi:hypothetical protein
LEFFLLRHCLAFTFPSYVVCLFPVCADLLAFVWAGYAANALPFIAAVTADIVVAPAVVDGLESYVGWDVALVLAVEAR